MAAHTPTLLAVAGVALAVASASAATIGIRQRLRRGVWWWLGANAALVAALASQSALGTEPWLAVAVAALALQWPIVTLAGMRRFFARGNGGVPPWADALALGLALLMSIGTGLAPFDGIDAAQVFAVAMIAVTGYTAFAVSRLDDFATTAVLKSLVIVLVCSACVQMGWLALSATTLAVSIGSAADAALLATAATALVMPQLSLVMNHERSVTNLRTSHRKLRFLVDVDALTRLPNRQHFHELAVKAVKPAPQLASVLVFDIDRLRHINDVLGHSVGDEALRQVGTVLRETLRRRDVAGRLGGDEFAVVLPRTPVADTGTVVSRVRAAIDDRQVAPRIARVVLNVGAVQLRAEESLVEALRRAEAELERSRDAARLNRQAEATIPLAPPAVATAATSSGPSASVSAASASAPSASSAAASPSARLVSSAASRQRPSPRAVAVLPKAEDARPAASYSKAVSDAVVTTGSMPLNFIPIGEVVNS